MKKSILFIIILFCNIISFTQEELLYDELLYPYYYEELPGEIGAGIISEYDAQNPGALLWPKYGTDSFPICNAARHQYFHSIESDGGSGALITMCKGYGITGPKTHKRGLQMEWQSAQNLINNTVRK